MKGGVGIRGWISIYLKGVCMGAADTVPGVSGGTIAVILGIYERLITALTSFDSETLGHLRSIHTAAGRSALAVSLLRADLPFLLVLGAGILSAAATVATAMNIAVINYPAPTYAFFFGLIAASAVVLYKYVDITTVRRALLGVLGILLAFLVTDPSLGGTRGTTLPIVFVAGVIAVSAMVLPGISGAFLLLVMGQYEYISGIPRRVINGIVTAFGGDVAALTEALVPFAAFATGAFVGLFSVAHAVRAALRRYRKATLVFLVSLMVGALRLPAHEVVENTAAMSPETGVVIGLPALLGAAGVFLLDRYTDDLQY